MDFGVFGARALNHAARVHNLGQGLVKEAVHVADPVQNRKIALYKNVQVKSSYHFKLFLVNTKYHLTQHK
jgi:hypothetical protein